MRCPKCKATLIYDGKKEYETILEHVSNPNQEKFPLRSTYTCPRKCFGEKQFFGEDGGSYGGNASEIKYFNALDSLSREIEIDIHIKMLYGIYRHHVSVLKKLIIEGERDIPPRWTWGFYWLKGRLIRIYYRYLYRMKKITMGAQ